MEEEDEASGVYRPSLIVEHLNEEKLPETEEFLNIQQWEPVLEMDDSQLVEASPVVAEEAAEANLVADAEMNTENEGVVVGEEATPMADSEMETGKEDDAVGEEATLVVDSEMESEKEAVLVVVGGEATPVADSEKEDDAVGEEATPVADSEKETASVGEEEATPVADAEMDREKEAGVVGEEVGLVVDVEIETEVAETSKGSGKRKRGRQAKVQMKAPPKKKEEEDVCFICFDGGNLVLCDRRGCPKAYHPACVNRDEAFFRSKGRWNCGWHICSNCEKPAHYMCYTCTYSLCKGCIKEADLVCVRGNKGFCGTCMRTVMLIEKNERGNGETAQVDFDDKNSWEYLFKDYWIDLKGKLSLTFDELTQARNPLQGSSVLAPKEDSSDEFYEANDDKGSSSDSSSEHVEASNSKRKKAKKRSKSLTKKEGSPSVARAVGGEGTSMPDGTEWASKELLEFVAHMNNGDISVLSQFDVQALLLEYIKRNNLRDPRRKSQIICDLRLETLFGKARVGHFEMLKLLESHFLIKEDSQVDDIHGGVVNTEASQLETDGNNDNLTKTGKDKRRKTRKKGDERGPQTNLDDYAAIDVHNINLIYLRRNLMEDLIEDAEKFHDKVVGSFVRIRISGNSQKQDMYRLVQVVGTGKATEPYKTGKRTTDIVLEILNLNKTEVISIDIISNQEFSEDECKRLRQSIKCGLINRLTVGEVQEKAMALQAARVNDWLETEILRLSHLRDRASEKGRRKELRECVEKLQLLKTPEERLRRLHEIPEVHADPNMDPSYESEEDGETDDKKRDNYLRPRDSGFTRKGREPISPGKGGSATNDTWSGARKNSNTSWELSRSMPTKGGLEKGQGATGTGERTNESSWIQGRDSQQFNSREKLKNQLVMTGSDTGTRNIHATVISGSSSGVASETSPPPLSTAVALSANISETDKIWHYQDPSGKAQGPFSMVQLRKWSTTGYFPTHLRIWKTDEKQDDSILLTDALIGKFHKEPAQPQNVTGASDTRENNWDGGWRGNNSSTLTERKQSEGILNSNWNDANGPPNGNTDFAKSDGLGPRSSGWTTPATEAFTPKEGQTGSFSRSSQPQVHSPRPSSSFSGNPYRTPSHQGREGQGGEKWNSGQNRGTWSSHRSPEFQSSSGHGHDKQSNNWVSSGHPSGENWRSQPENSSPKVWTTPSSIEVPKYSTKGGSSDRGNINDSSNFSTPTPEPSSAGWTGGLVSGNKMPVTPSIVVQPEISGGGNTQIRVSNGAQTSQTAMPEPAMDASVWSEHHRISVTPPVEVWDSNSGFASMPKPSEKSEQDGRIDFSNPPTPTPKASSGGWKGDKRTQNEWAATSVVPVQQTSPSWGGPPNFVGYVAHQSPLTVKERIEVTAEWDMQPPTLAKPSGGDWDYVPPALKPTETTIVQDASTVPESAQLRHSTTSPPGSVKPSEGFEGWRASHASSSQQMSVPGPSDSLNQSVSDIPTKDDSIESLSGLVPLTSVANGGGDLTLGSQGGYPSTLHGLSPTPDPGKGFVLSSTNLEITSQSTLINERHGASQVNVLDRQKKSGEHSPAGVIVDGEMGPKDVSADVPKVKGLLFDSQPDPLVPDSAGNLTNEGAVSMSDVISLSKTSDPSVSNLVPFFNSHKPPDETHGWAFTSAQKPEMVDSYQISGFESHGRDAAPAQKQELPNSSPMLAHAAQKPDQSTYGNWANGGTSSVHNAAAPFSTGGQARNHPTQIFSVSDLVPSGNSVIPSITKSSDLSIASTVPPPRPPNWDGGPCAATGNPQNNSLAPIPWKPPVSGYQLETGPNIQPSAQPTASWPVGAAENPSTLWRPPMENSNTGWVPPTQGNANMGWGGSGQGNTNMGWGAGQGIPQGNANMGRGAPAGNPGMWGGQQKHNGERFSGQGDRGFQGGDSGYGAGRPSWNRQSSFGSGGGGGRPPPKGPRVCKYHESGHCKKGATCDYLHT